MIVVTGAAGFIGANIVKGLNNVGRTDILVVDDLSRAEKIVNLADCRFADYMDKHEFLVGAENNTLPESITAIFHEGACSDTMASDGRYVMENNYAYTKSLYQYCGRHGVQFLYASSASVYGGGATFVEHADNEHPLNTYAFSKWAFDHHVRQHPPQGFQAVGLRYFNVYGDREQHKGRMASVAYHFFNQYLENGSVKLFEGTAGYANGGQLRDFISVEDVVKVNLFLLEHPEVTGTFLNVGTGTAHSFNDVALAVVNRLRAKTDHPPIDMEQAQAQGLISYIPMPEALQGKYQSYTEADISALRSTGYNQAFYDVDSGVGRYVDALWQKSDKTIKNTTT